MSIQPVELNYRHFAQAGGEPLIVLHGLLGSSRNWLTAGKGLAERYDVYAADLRNHGESPHAERMDYPALVADLGALLDRLGCERAHLMGHSLGGKVCMKFACEQPARVRSLCVLDIAAKAYPPHYAEAFAAMGRVDLASLRDRKEAEEVLKSASSSWAFRQFLLTNLVRDRERGGFRWQCNFEVRARTVDGLAGNPLTATDRYADATLLLTGGESDFVTAADIVQMRQHFPNLRHTELLGVSHNLHVEDTESFLAAYLAFQV